MDALRRAPGEAGQARAVPDPAPIATRAVRDRVLTVDGRIHAALDQVPIGRSVIRAVRDRASTVGDPTPAVLGQAPIDSSVTRAARDRALIVRDPIHAAPAQAPIDRSVIHGARGRALIVRDPIHAVPEQVPIDRSVIHGVRDRVLIVRDPIHAVPNQVPIDHSVTLAMRDRVLTVGDPIHAALEQVLIAGVPTLGALHRLATARAVILAVAIPAHRGLLPDPGDPTLLAVDVRSPTPGARDLALTALALIARNLLAAAPPLIPVLQRLSRHSRSLILASRSSMLQSGNPLLQSGRLMPLSGSPTTPMLLPAIPIHISMSLTLLKKGRILTSKCPKLIARNPARVGPGLLLAVAAPLVARMLKASACKRCYLAQGSRRAARLRTGFALAASPSTANLPCSAPACRPPTNCASTVASFANARRVAGLQHSLCTVRPAKV